MKNITLSAEEHLIAAARARAQAENTTLFRSAKRSPSSPCPPKISARSPPTRSRTFAAWHKGVVPLTAEQGGLRWNA